MELLLGFFHRKNYGKIFVGMNLFHPIGDVMDAMIFPAGNAEVLPIHSHVFLEFLTYTKLINVYTPQKLTWIPKITIFERRYILKTCIFGIYVKFQRGTYYNKTRRNAKKTPSIPHPLLPHATIPPKTSRSPGINHTSPIFRRKSHGIRSIQTGNLSINIWKTKHWNTQKNGGVQKIWCFHVQRKSIFRVQPALSVFGEKKNIPSKAFLFLVAASPRNHSLWSQCVLLLHHRVDDRSMFEASNRTSFRPSSLEVQLGYPSLRGWWQRVLPFFNTKGLSSNTVDGSEIPNNHLRCITPYK